MIDRIETNEERLNQIISSIKTLENALKEFNANKNNIKLVNKYYCSKNWFKDKDAYEQSKIEHIKAGVLSEDAVWNMNESINDLMKEMKKIISFYKKD